VPVPLVPPFRSYVVWPPRPPSIRSKPPEAEAVVPMVTVPLYWLVPVPVSTAS
jgi:hypothetical protein